MPQDDWDRAAAIKRGEGDWPGYDTLKAWIQRTPKTMLPALMMQMVASCLHENVFVEGGLIRFVERCEADWNKPGHGALRED